MKFLRGLVYVMMLAAVGILAQGADGNREIPDLKLRLLWIKPGAFDMGTLMSGVDNQQPITHVTFAHGFWLGQTEVTQAQWQAIMGGNPSDQKGGDLPVNLVDWDDAMKFCRKLTERERAAGRLADNLAYTLPTEAQWEYASRAGRTAYDIGAIKRVFIDYTEINTMAWNDSNSGEAVHPVAQKKANAWGFHDMQGNVAEWCLDAFAIYDGQSNPDRYPGGNAIDPSHAPDGNLRHFRGGSAAHKPSLCTSTFRWWEFRSYKSSVMGFRVALSLVR